MIYGSSYASSSSSTVPPPEEEERRPLIQSHDQLFWNSRAPVTTNFGALDQTPSDPPAQPSEDYSNWPLPLRLIMSFLKKLETEHEPGLTNTQLLLTNHDLKPVEPARRTWGPWNYVGFWIADSFNVNTWMISSSMIIAGLSWWQSWLCVWIGYFIAACFIVLTGRIGAVYHIGFPVVARSSFGIWGSLWPVFNRAGMACIWYGVQAWIGGQCVELMIRSIWPSWDAYFDTKNTMSPSSGTNTRDYVSFFLFWLLSLPAIWFPVHQIRHLFTLKAYVVPIAGFAFFGWSIQRAGGLGPIVKQGNTIHGSQLAWALVAGIMSSIANFATLIVNDPDFTRFAIKPRDQLWSQLITIPSSFAFTSFIGIIVSSSSALIFKESIWNPLELLGKFLDDGKSGDRAGVFFIALAFSLAQLGTNIAANSVSAGTDLTALMPRFINIRRGGYFCAIIGLAMCPWNLLSSSNKFTLYLSSYSVFLSSIAGVMISDYYFVRKGYLDIRALYSARRTGAYYYNYGIHWRGYVAYICGILINIVGFVGEIGAHQVPIGATYLYRVNFFGGFIVSSSVYYLCCQLSPIPACATTWTEVGEEITEVTLAEDADAVSIGSASGGDEESGAKKVDEKRY